MSQRVPAFSLSKGFYPGGIEKSSLKRATSVLPTQERAGDPKPGELAMTRVNSAEKREEARTRGSFNILG